MQPTRQTDTAPFSPTLQTAITLAELLQRVEGSPRSIGARQYQHLARHLGSLLGELAGDARLPQLLATFPAAAMVYENLQYAHAGLCRAPLEASLNSELGARELIERVRATRA